MASITNDGGGRRRIQFVDTDGNRRAVRLGKVSERRAEEVKFRIERILEAKVTGFAIEAETARWIADLPDELAKKFARVKLIPARTNSATKLGPFLDDFMERRIDVKPATKEIWNHTKRNLIGCFGPERELPSIGEGEAEDFKMFLVAQELASTTVHKRLQFARMFFRAAKKRKLIEENPFAEVSSKAVVSKDRQHFVTREVTERLLAISSLTWQLIISLARYGGLRCPSEVLSLRWDDIDWDASRIVVQSPKTEHHEGKESRVIPLFPELRSVLEKAAKLAPEGAEHVVNEYRAQAITESGWRNCNLRTQFERIIKRAGLKPWPRLFHALRASRETELAKNYPIHVVTAWLGNTPRIAIKHYLQVTDADFENAAGVTTTVAESENGAPAKSGAESGAPAAHFPAQQAHAPNRTISQAQKETPARARVYASRGDLVRNGATIKKRRGQDSNLRKGMTPSPI